MIDHKQRLALEWVGAAGFSILLFAFLPLAAVDPFRASLAPIPIWLLAFRTIERNARSSRQRGARPTAPEGPFSSGGAEAAALAALVLLTLARNSLGLAVTDWFLAAGFLLLLAHRVCRLLLALRPSLGQRLPPWPGWPFFLLPWVIYLALLPWSTDQRQPDGDEPYYLLLTHSIAYDFDTDLSNNYEQGDWRSFMDREIGPQSGDPVGPEGQLYSRHNSLLPILLAPAYRLLGPWGARIVLSALAAALAWMFLRLAWRYAPEQPGASLLAYACFAFAPPLLVYSQQVWIEVPAALLLALTLDRLLALPLVSRAESSPATLRRPRDLFLFGLGLVLLPLLKLRLGLVAATLLLLAWRRLRPGGGTLLRFGSLLGAAAGFLLISNQLRFGNPLKNHGWGELALLLGPPERALRSAFGMFYDSAFGLFAQAPIWLLLLPAVVLAWRQRSTQLFHLLWLSLPYFLLLTPRLEWYGGWSPAFRYLLVFLPLIALQLIPLLRRRHLPGLRALIFGLGSLTLILALVWMIIPGWTYNFADGSTHLLDQASVRLEADVARLFPSSVRPRLATWLWPLLSLLLIPVALWDPRRSFPGAPRWGVTALLLAVSLIPFASAHWPNHTLELEDDFVRKERGRPYPMRWTQGRAAFPGGWIVYPKTRVSAPVVSGSNRLVLKLTVRFVENIPSPFTLRISAGDQLLTTWTADQDRKWQTLELGPFAWPEGAPLVFQGPDEPASPTSRNGLILDRVELLWL